MTYFDNLMIVKQQLFKHVRKTKRNKSFSNVRYNTLNKRYDDTLLTFNVRNNTFYNEI